MKQLLKKLARKVFGRGADGPAKAADTVAARDGHRAHAPRPAAEGGATHRPPHGRASSQEAGSGTSHGHTHHGAPRGGGHGHGHGRGHGTEHGPAADKPSHARAASPALREAHGAAGAARATATSRHAAWDPASFVVPPAEGRTRFQDLDLPGELLHAVADLEFQYCTPIQAQVLGAAIQGRNIVGRAQTGTGKTAAFLIATFTRFLRGAARSGRPVGAPRALVLAPTRELVIQIAQDAKDLGTYTGLHCVAVYGGMDFDKQARALQSGPVDLIAATPGRLLDFARRGTLDLRHVDVLVIDEADRMLDMGFIPDVKTIVRKLPPKEARQTLFFTATLTDDVRRLAAQWTDHPVTAEVAPEQVAVKTVKQLVYAVASHEKFTVLYNQLRQPECGRVLIFGNRRDSTMDLAERLQRYGMPCGLLSGAIDQKKRLRILEQFKSGEVKVLVATDVAGRGLHIDEITHVINYDFPYEAEDYVHRIGRTGRAGAEGTAISFACEDESFVIPEIEKYIGESLTCCQPAEALFAALPALPGGEPSRASRPDRAAYRGGGSYGRGGRPGGPGGRRPGGPRRPRR